MHEVGWRMLLRAQNLQVLFVHLSRPSGTER